MGKAESGEYIPIFCFERHSYGAVRSLLECYHTGLAEHSSNIESCYGEICHASSAEESHLSTKRTTSQEPSSPDPWSNECETILRELIQSEACFKEDLHCLVKLLEWDMETGNLAVGIVGHLCQSSRSLWQFSKNLFHAMNGSETEYITLISLNAHIRELTVCYKEYILDYRKAAWILPSSNDRTEMSKLLIARPIQRLFDYRNLCTRLLTLTAPGSSYHTICRAIVDRIVQVYDDIENFIPDPCRGKKSTTAPQCRSWSRSLCPPPLIRYCPRKRTQLRRSICDPKVLMETWVLRHKVSRYQHHMNIILEYFKSARLRSKELGMIGREDDLFDAVEAFLRLFERSLSAHLGSYLLNLVTTESSDPSNLPPLASIEDHFNCFREAWRWRWEAIIARYADCQLHLVMECAESDHQYCHCDKPSHTF